MIRRAITALAIAAAFTGNKAAAQDTIPPIPLGVHGVSGARQPNLVVLAGVGIDSVRAIVQRDLQNSDRYTVIPRADSFPLRGPFNPIALKDAGVTWVVELQRGASGIDVKLWDMTGAGTVRQQATANVDISGAGDPRMSIHRLSDQVVSWIGGIGMAATRIAFKNGKDGGIWRIDSDGANLVRVSPPRTVAMTPAWSPDGAWLAYSENRDGPWVLFLQRIATGTRNAVPSSFPSNSYGPAFSPDGKTLVFAHGPADKEKAKGFDLESANVSNASGMCCAHRLTFSGTLADNFSPTYSHDGNRIAFESNRTGHTAIWVIDADGTGPTQPVPASFDAKGRTLDMHTPAWSPDGSRIAFSGDTDGGGRQVFYWSVGSGSTIKITSNYRNEDASWAPDSRHLVFKSDRSGSDQLWILDIETGAWRQLTSRSTTLDGLRYAAWSHTLGTNP